MRSLSLLFLTGLLLLSSIALAQPAPPSQMTSELVLSSPFIFRGTVVRRGSPMPRPAPTQYTVTVRVDEILRGAREIGDFTGQEIAVERTSRREGNVATFFTRPSLYGKTLAVTEVGELPPMDSKRAQEQIAAIEQQEKDRQLKRRLETAEAVITGRVMDVNPLEKRDWLPSEHDPQWWVARVRVVRTWKGQPRTVECPGGRCVQVAFSASRDIVWAASPKLAPDEEAILLLRRDAENVPDAQRPKIDAYLLVHPQDRWPRSEESRIRALLSARPQ